MSNFRMCLTALLLLVSSQIGASQKTAAPVVIASIAPLHSLVAAVMQDIGTPHLLLRGRASPHSFSLRPSEARLLNQADLLFWIGPTLEQPLRRILPNTALRQSVALIDAPGVTLLDVRGTDRGDHHHHHDDHAHGPIDPHIWLSPKNAAAIAREIARSLAAADPTRADVYQANTERLLTRLTELDRALRKRLSGIHGTYAVYHDAYQYLERHYDLQSVASVSINPERRPGAAHLQKLHTELEAKQVHCLFSEPQFQSNLVDMLSDQLSIRHAVLDPLGATVPPGPNAYETLMLGMADALSECMRGGK